MLLPPYRQKKHKALSPRFEHSRKRDRPDFTFRIQKRNCEGASLCNFLFYFSSNSSKAARTAAITKAEKVQSFPRMASSTCSITSFGNRMVLLVVSGMEGI